MTKDVIRGAVAGAIGELTGISIEKISDADDLVDDLGVDSMAAASLLIAIEGRAGVTIPDGSEGSLVGIRTVGELVDRLTFVFALDVA